MARGFIKNKTTPAAIHGNWTSGIEVTGTVDGDAGHDANSRPLPSACHISHMDLIFSGISHGTSMTFDLRVTYDEAGRDPVFPPLAGQRPKNSRVANVKHHVIGVDADGFGFTAPATALKADGTSALGSIFVHINPTLGDSGTVTIDTIRFHWNDSI